MKRVVWKYAIIFPGVTEIDCEISSIVRAVDHGEVLREARQLPPGSRPKLHADIWVEHDDLRERNAKMRITAVSTGDSFDPMEVGEYVGTVGVADKAVAHVYAKIVRK